MELEGCEVDVSTSETGENLDLNDGIAKNNSGTDLDETEKLQVSSDLPNYGDEDDDDDDDIVAMVRSKKKKDYKIVDSDSENEGIPLKIADEDDHDEEHGITNIQNASEPAVDKTDDDSEDDSGNEQTKGENIQKDESPPKQSSTERYRNLIDSDSDGESAKQQDAESDSDGEENGNRESDKEVDRKGNVKIPKKRSDVPKRMSAKQAMDQMKAIKSETQRLNREAYVTIPYHEPKHYTLKEFLNRRTINKPSLRTPQAKFSLKMNQEELEQYAQQLAEREKEATDFFKSDARKRRPFLEDEDYHPAEKSEKADDKEETAAMDELDGDKEDIERTDFMEDFVPKTQDAVVVDSKDDLVEDSQENDMIAIQETENEMNMENVLESQQDRLVVKDTEDQVFLPSTCDSVTIPETEESVLTNQTENIDFGSSNPIESENIDSPRLSEEIHEILKERNFNEHSPALTGSPNTFIDLETGNVIPPKRTGVDRLVERFLKNTVKKKPKESTSMSIVSTDNGTLEVTNVTVALNDDEVKEQKPGAAYFKLKDNLMEVIKKKRKEVLRKKLEEMKDESDKENDEDFEEYEDDIEKRKCLEEDENEKGDKMTDEEENLIDDEEVEGGENNDEANDDLEENVAELENEPIDTDADDEYDSEDDENDDEGDDEDDELFEEPKLTKRRIVINADDSDDEDEKNNSFHINLDTEENGNLWKDDTKESPGDEDELLGLCSGRFAATQNNAIISQMPTTQPQDGINETELLALCSGTFQDATQTQKHNNELVSSPSRMASKMLESSDEESEERYTVEKKPRQKTRKLGFSDDEEEDEDEVEDNDEAKNTIQDDDEEDPALDDAASNEEDIPETYIDYDSEENEVEVQMTKTDCRKKASEFFEKEAELSESEWGSADEDEKNLDHYDMDLVDNQEFDKEKLQTELGRIHMRRLLDDDIREVKKIQEMLFEDEELDGVGRERQFRWKNLEGGFDLDTYRMEMQGKEGEDDIFDEARWRIMRMERQMLLEEKLGVLDHTLKPEVTNSAGKKIKIISSAATSAKEVSTVSSPFLITKSLNSNRGSFLIRDDATLSKLATITKTSTEQETGTVQVRTAKAQNFVFAAINTPESEKSLKRKSTNNDQDAESNHRKKMRTSTKTKTRLLDQLA